MILSPSLLFILASVAASAPPDKSAAPPIIAAMEAELARVKELKSPAAERPYFVAYEVVEDEGIRLESSWGALVQDTSNRSRTLDIDLRVGDYALDSSREVRGEMGRGGDAGRAVPLPLQDEPMALRQVLWRETDAQLKDAVERLSRVKASVAVKVESQDSSGDFSPDEARIDLRPTGRLAVERGAWADALRKASRVFLESSHVYEASVALEASASARYFVSTDGTRLALPDPHARAMVYGATRAEDGMELFRFEGWEARQASDLPGEERLVEASRRVMADLEALRTAPIVEPFTGPAILSGRAAAVFFHEIFGHRIEGHRQKSDDEGQTFTKKIGQPVLPAFLSVIDDPSLPRFGEIDLMGHYAYDNEGVPGQRSPVVVDGVLQGFLMSRSPVEGFGKSNGHGRRQPGYAPVGRQGNLLVESKLRLTAAELRAKLKELVRRQKKPFGLYFEDISGGFTFTNRDAPQSYKVLPIMVYRVFPDERPDELVRGVDIVGTPLASFAKIVATGGEPEVFNGYCGAESGYVPVSAVAPSILVSEMEIEKRSKGVERPPILPAPTLQGVKP